VAEFLSFEDDNACAKDSFCCYGCCVEIGGTVAKSITQGQGQANAMPGCLVAVTEENYRRTISFNARFKVMVKLCVSPCNARNINTAAISQLYQTITSNPRRRG